MLMLRGIGVPETEKPDPCIARTRDGLVFDCKSEDEFEELIEKHFGF